jgi:hypothetical protein
MESLLNFFTLQKVLRIAYLLLLIVAFIMLVSGINSKLRVSTSYEPTLSPHLNLSNTEAISSSLSGRDYLAFQDRLRDFVTRNNQSPVSNVEIKNVVVPVREGSVTTVTLKIPSVSKSDLVVLVDYANGPNGLFSIPSSNYSVPLYGQSYNN